MNESMRSVADIPGDDVEDDLSGISPELVLIDPELARLVRERQTDEASPAARRVPTLRLVEGGSAEQAIVPRPVESTPPVPAAPSGETLTSSVPAPIVEPPREQVAPVASSASTPVVVEPVVDVLPVPASESEPGPVARRVIDAEPARAVPFPEVEAPAVALDRLADVTVPAAQPAHGFSTMPHPVARPATQRRARASAGSRKRGRARGVLAFLIAVAVASAAVLGITRLTAGSSEGTSGKGATAAVGAPPVAKKSAGKTKAASSTKKPATKKPARPKPKPAASKPAVTKPAAPKKTSGANAPTKPKTTAAAKPKTQASVKPKPKTTTAKPKVATTPPEDGRRARGSRDTTLCVGAGRRRGRVPRRAVPRQRPRARPGHEGARPRARAVLALPGTHRDAHARRVPLVRLAGHGERPRHPGGRPGEAVCLASPRGEIGPVLASRRRRPSIPLDEGLRGGVHLPTVEV